MQFVTPRMKICVLGGTGFLGTELVTRLAAAGHWVRVPTRVLSHGTHLTVLPTVELRAVDIHEPRVLGELLAGMDAVVNLVGILNERPGARFKAVHVELVAKVIEEARLARVRRLVHVSALGADAARAPSRYLRSKGAAEALVRGAAPLECTLLRPSVIFGRGDSLTTRFVNLLRLSGGVLPLARADAKFTPVSVDDVAEALVRALTDRATSGRSYDLCGPEVFTLAQIVRAAAAAAHARCHILPLPGLLGWLEALVMGLVPGKPFSLDNFRSLGLDSVSRENGLLELGIEPQRMAAVLPVYLGNRSLSARLDRPRMNSER
ncbi:MAG: complex I NDUFA9 subunit family protein [Steroidobacteraceae bacterium]